MYSRYFLAKVCKKQAWLISGTLHYFGHIGLERGIIGQKDMFEFFVPQDMVDEFLFMMNKLLLKKVVLSFWEEVNRFDLVLIQQ